MVNKNFKIKLGDKEIEFTITNLAEQANGSVLVRLGDTVVLVTAVMSSGVSQNQDFFPLTVDYEERFYAAGKILGSRFIRREGRPTDDAIITARLIDRAIRPLFPKDFRKEVQVIVTCLSWDGIHDPDVLGLLGASAALSLSDIPWNGPVGTLRVGKVNDAFVLNPTYEERPKSAIDFLIAGIKKDGSFLLNMIEGSGEEAPEETFKEAFAFAQPFLMQLIDAQEKLREEFGAKKQEIQTTEKNTELEKEIKEFLSSRLPSALFEGAKQARMKQAEQILKELMEAMKEKYPDGTNDAFIKSAFHAEVDRIIHEAALREEKRVDGRKIDELRPLGATVGLLPRTHGSGYFERGQTKTLSILTLGGPGDQRLMEGMEFIGKKRFMHHYNFPPYSSGEVKPMRGPGRREIGHGMLAEKALLPVLPTLDNFPYTVRIVTEVVSSNGSTSMASTCSSSLALMDAGVPITAPVAGISLGLMSGDKGEYKILTDIQGPEDHYGDMDFKVAGTKQGITAIQLDVKIQGITEKIFEETLERAKKARFHIIDEVITKTIPQPRPELSPWAPRVFIIQINPEKIGMVIGTGGKTINKIMADFGVEIDIEDTGEVFISSQDAEGAKKAMATVESLTREAKVGEFFQGKVKKVTDFGAFVEILPGQEGLVHISQLAPKRIEKVTDIVKVGDSIPVKVIGIDEQGRINLSRKEALQNHNS